MSDLISRQAVLDAVNDCGICIQKILDIPSAELETFEFCSGGDNPCKEYDQEKHCCHRWTKVIRQTVEDMKNRWKWIPVTEALPEEKGEYLVSYHPCHWNTVSEKVVVGIDTFRGKTTWAKMKYQKVIAWMPLPEAWRGEDGKA